MNAELTVFRKGREYVVNELIANLSLNQINSIPDGFTGNIGWHLGHLVTTHRGLIYQLHGHRSGMEKEFILKYALGSKPENPMTQEELDFIKKRLIEQCDELEADEAAGIFTGEYRTYNTTSGMILHNHEEAVAYSNFHQAMHVGYIMAMRRLV